VNVGVSGLGLVLLILAIAWMVAPVSRWRIRRAAAGAGLLLIALVALWAYASNKG